MAESGTAASFGALYERHARYVYRFALALTANFALAEDLTSEAFLRVWQAGSRVESLTVRGYLVTIVRNLYRTEWRRDQRHGPLPPELAAPALDASARLELAQVLEALGQLAASDREILLMRAEAEMAYEEIALLLGITAQAARARAHRARQRLMEALCPKTE